MTTNDRLIGRVVSISTNQQIVDVIPFNSTKGNFLSGLSLEAILHCLVRAIGYLFVWKIWVLVKQVEINILHGA